MARSSLPKKLFILWLQGWENAPDVVVQCRRSWEHYNPSWQIHFLTRDNVGEYLELDSFRNQFKVMPPQAIANIIRIHLLETYGGVWADATCFCCKPLDEWLHDYLQSGFFAFGRPGRDRMMANWFMAAQQGNPLVGILCQAVRNYWLQNPKLRPFKERRRLSRIFEILGIRQFLLTHPWIWHTPPMVKGLKVFPYFWFHYLFERCYRRSMPFREIWDATIQVDPSIPLVTRRVDVRQPIMCDIKKEIDDRIVPLYKLKWRLKAPQIPDGSTLAYLVRTLDGRVAPGDCSPEVLTRSG